jgi:hypothetical protein
MQLIDSTLAFALTLAALATVVSVIMEACVRLSRMRKKNFIEVMKLLNDELGKGALGMDEEERWRFFVKVVQNPVKEGIEQLNPALEKLKPADRLAHFGYDKHLGKGRIMRFFIFLGQLFGDKKRSGLYTTVSLEYMLRCLADSPPVKKASLTAGETIKTEFNRIARKYEEFGSSVSASFKHHAQAWSIAIGIALAICANIDGLRIFEAYRVNPGLASGVIEHQEAFRTNLEESQESQAKIDKAIKAYEEAKKMAEQADSKNPEGNEAVKNASAVLEKMASLKNVQATAQRAQQQLADLVALGVPIGWRLYPDCPYGDTLDAWAMSSPKCRAIPIDKRGLDQGKNRFLVRLAKTLWYDFSGFVLWFLVTVGTGMLIGLGAPFWFDVAKRLAQIRKGVQNATASAEYRLSGSDANGKYEKRKEIVNNVLSDAADEAAVERGGAGSRRAFFDVKGDDYDRIS